MSLFFFDSHCPTQVGTISDSHPSRCTTIFHLERDHRSWFSRFHLTRYINIEARIPKSILRALGYPVDISERVCRCSPHGPASPPPSFPDPSTYRTVFTTHSVLIYASPAEGGLIILEDAQAIDFEFLGLDHLNPPATRLGNQNEEDKFCQKLLLLGAKRWESDDRFYFVADVLKGDESATQELEDEAQPELTPMERRWMTIGWPTSGGFWVAEDDGGPPDEAGSLSLAKTMDERCQILREQFSARFYEDVKDYQGFDSLDRGEEREVEVSGEFPENI